jgi:ribosome-associated protein
LILIAEKERSQLRNRQKVTMLFFELIEKALTPAKRRIKTKPTGVSRKKRLENKKQQSEKKSRRRPPKF